MAPWLSCMAGIARDCELQSTALFMNNQKLMTSCRKSFSRFGTRRAVIHQRQASHLDGWLLSPGVAPLTGCAGARLILVRGSAMRNASRRNHKLRVGTQLKDSFGVISVIS